MLTEKIKSTIKDAAKKLTGSKKRGFMAQVTKDYLNSSPLKGLPVAYELVPANTDERKSVEGILETVRYCDVYGDKGFIGQDWQQQIASSTGNRIWTIHRQNQNHQISSDLKRLISRVRQRIEGVFHEIQNTGRTPW